MSLVIFENLGNLENGRVATQVRLSAPEMFPIAEFGCWSDALVLFLST